MRRVHPNANAAAVAVADRAVENEKPPTLGVGEEQETEVLTVWRKSLLFNGNGYTVFDAKGNLVFRVDNYASENKGEIVLMDAAGKPLLTIRRKKLSLADQWLIYDGEETTNPRFSVKKHITFTRSKSLAHINRCQKSNGGEGSPSSSPKFFNMSSGSGSRSPSPVSSPRAGVSSSSSAVPAFEVKGSYAQRCCTIYDDAHSQIAEIKRKESNGGVVYGLDVFHLIVQPGFDAAVAMAIVILLEQMFGSKGPSLLIKY